ncbi:hypothetical protein [Haloarcula sp. JP-L23]|uniref:hypothetical protein n=1 Tax=Haloarcula sp. JP-L23 TaxID=2716717 RepID=UPI00140EC19B|nr:hypothetical protein G9465_14275 [Haloarcula sp. JP-L23]
MALSELWAVEMLLAAFAGGAFGAAIGALPSFTLAGLLVVVGELYKLVVRTTGADAVPVDITGTIGFGVVLGPHVAFGGGAAALAYATKQGYLDGDFEYHPAKDVARGLGSKPDVLAVGGVFGVVGYWIATVSSSVSVPVDPVALGVVGSAVAHRLAFGYSLVGAAPSEWFDMRPDERGRDTEDSGGAVTDGGTAAVEPWLPYQYRWSDVAMLGAVVGVLGGYVAYLTASPFLAFGISVVALVFVNAGVANVPVTHHMSLPASTAALALVDAPAAQLTPAVVAGSVPLGLALFVGAAFGVLGSLLGEVVQRIFYAHAETHFDPPAASIVLTSLVVALLALLGVVESPVWVPLP